MKEEAVTEPKSSLGTAIGDKAPNIILNDLESKPVLLSDYKGKKHLIVNFWATWCPPCKEEMPLFQKLYEENKDELVILGINLQENPEPIKKFLEEYKITYPILLDPDAEVKKLYNVITQPVTYFINKEGIIVDKKQGPLTPEEINEKVGKLLKSKSIESSQKDEIKTLPDGTKYIVHPSKLLSGGPPKDGIPSIDKPRFISVEDANKFVRDDELVLGINLNGDKRAYPFQILVWHEIVNDVVNGKPVAITYCPLCGTGIAYERTISNQPVEFGDSGLLYNSDLVMYDRKTDTLWDQVTGRAIVGELIGMRLKQMPIDTLTWSDWKKLHPDTKVLSRETGFIRSYGRTPYGDYDTSRSIYFPVENEDLKLHPKEVIFGVEINGKFKAYTEEDLKKLGKIEDTFNGVALIAERSDAGIVTIKNKDANEDIIPVRSFWFAWFAFHPDTELYKA
ncbi:DUF3179 domain-containing protein [Candidatus Woesearchaeota archaeon]|nr:DUF3179 domain-containing protein [Candidatus Woesearchaeota archaeon]